MSSCGHCEERSDEADCHALRARALKDDVVILRKCPWGATQPFAGKGSQPCFHELCKSLPQGQGVPTYWLGVIGLLDNPFLKVSREWTTKEKGDNQKRGDQNRY